MMMESKQAMVFSQEDCPTQLSEWRYHRQKQTDAMVGGTLSQTLFA